MKAASVALLVPTLLITAVPLAWAQQPSNRTRSRDERPPVVVVPPPRAPLPQMPAALTVPNPFAGFIPGRRDLFQSRFGFDRFQRRPRFYSSGPGGFSGLGGFSSYADSYAFGLDTYGPQEPPVVEAQPGALVLLSTPSSAQVFVDGFYAGIVEEFGALGHPMPIVAGPHRIELRADGYETLLFNVMIEPNEIVRYRGDMRLLQPGTPAVSAPPPAPPRTAKSFYVIPRCYAGDRPPRGPLPAGCDRRNLQTYK